MKILRLTSGTTLTVDSTQITVDTTTITVDTTTNQFSGFSFVITSREFVEECEMIFYNELKDTTQTVIGYGSYFRGLLKLDFAIDEVEENDSFQVTINKLITGELLWRGKAFATSQIDLENFTMTKPGTNNIIKI
jgi:hypothetical protein